MRSRALFLSFSLLVVALACSTPRQNLKPLATKQDDGEGFSLILNNRHYLDVNVFVHHDGQASRVATVTGSSSLALSVPRWMVGKGGLVRIIAEPIGANSSYATDNLVIQSGQIVEVNVESSIARSNYSVQ